MEIVVTNISDDEIDILEENDFDWCPDSLYERNVVLNGNRNYINTVLRALGREGV